MQRLSPRAFRILLVLLVAPIVAVFAWQELLVGRAPHIADVELPPASATDPDGADDGAPLHMTAALAALARAPRARFQSTGGPAGAHPMICDVVAHGGGLAAVSTLWPLEDGGARVHGYRDGVWQVALAWDDGEGFARVRVLDGALWVPDADPPGRGFHTTEAPFEGYAYVSDGDGRFATDPGAPVPRGARVLPWSFHAFDVVRYRGAVVVSGGTVARPDAWSETAPGALHAGGADDGVLPVRIRAGDRFGVGVVRATYMHRFRGRVYIGMQNNERRARWDAAVLSDDPRAPDAAAVLVRLTEDGGWQTWRWASGAGRLYWVATRHGRGAPRLRVSSDGVRFALVALPDGAGAPRDVIAIDDVVFVLTTGGLYRGRAGGPLARIADAPPGDPFDGGNAFCSAPLAAAPDGLYAGSTRDGTVYRIVAEGTE